MTDLEMMKNPLRWPIAYLPVKRYVEGQNGPECGLMVPHNSSTVFLVNLYDNEWFGKQWTDLPQIKYDTYEDVISDGWMVD